MRNTKLLRRNTVIGILVSLGVLGANSAQAYDWSDTPRVIGTIVGGGVGAAVASFSTNPFIVGASGALGSVVGAEAGAYVGENPRKSVKIASVAASSPSGWMSQGVSLGISKSVTFFKNFFS
jgi:hypothetical protein